MTETRTCQNCKNPFTIEPEDFLFYDKIHVPPPTWCPECRLKRRLIHYSKRTLYKRKCDLCKKEMFSMYDAANPITVYCNPCWWSDKWDPMTYGQEVDFSRPFFAQLGELLKEVPWMALGTDHPTMINSEYCNAAGNLKNCYLLFFGDYNEDSSYCDTIHHSKDCVDCYIVEGSERCYESTDIEKCYQAHYSVDCDDSYDIFFSRDLIGCSNCFGCVNLRKKQYHIFNKPYTKEAYFKALKDFDLGSHQNVVQMGKRVAGFFSRYPRKFYHGRHNVNVSGDYIVTSKNAHDSFLLENTEDSRYCLIAYGEPIKDCYDYSFWGENAARLYECVKCGYNVDNLKFCNGCWSSSRDLEYTTFCIGSHNLFGCVGLRNKEYAILNKQYTKDVYEKLVQKITEQMHAQPHTDSRGRTYQYGEFIPPDFSPFSYNESILQEFFPLTKDQALAQGYRWKDAEERHIAITLSPDKLPDHIKDVQDSITQEIIQCQHTERPASIVSNSMELDTQVQSICNEQCTTAFKIIPQELAFYRKMNLPLPRLCPNCRHYARLRQRNPLKLWKRQCMCGGAASENLPALSKVEGSTDSTSSPQASSRNIYTNTAMHRHGQNPCLEVFETSYAPEREEIVYCEQCYNAEVV